MEYMGDPKTTISVNLPRELVEEWKYLVEMRQKVEGHTVDPVEALRQAIATEAYLWQKKDLERPTVSPFGIQYIGRINRMAGEKPSSGL